MSEPNVVWSATLDKRYAVVVTRVRPYDGLLQVTDLDGTLILDRPVTLSYQAMFGPDVADVADWERLACEAIDAKARG